MKTIKNAKKLVSDVITILPSANMDLLVLKPQIFLACTRFKNCIYLKSMVGKGLLYLVTTIH